MKIDEKSSKMIKNDEKSMKMCFRDKIFRNMCYEWHQWKKVTEKNRLKWVSEQKVVDEAN